MFDKFIFMFQHKPNSTHEREFTTLLQPQGIKQSRWVHFGGLLEASISD